MTNYCLEKFKYEIEPDQLFSYTDAEVFFINIKEEFFDPDKYKWSDNRFKEFIAKNNLDVGRCYLILVKFNEIYFYRNQKGAKGFNNFLKKIKKIKGCSSSKISIKTNSILFLEELQKFRELHFSEITNKVFIQFVDDNFKTIYTKATLRRTLYEEGVFRKTSTK